MCAAGIEEASVGVQVTQATAHGSMEIWTLDDAATEFAGAAQPNRRDVRYGLPCSHCGAYYTADLSACPICKSAERVSPTEIATPLGAKKPQHTANANELNEQCDRFLRSFESQPFSGHMHMEAETIFHCSQEENHAGRYAPAAVCEFCYDRVRERVDLLEAALCMDLKEAAKIVYDAVWADPSDSRKTYQNAAQALLTELRKRAKFSADKH